MNANVLTAWLVRIAKVNQGLGVLSTKSRWQDQAFNLKLHIWTQLHSLGLHKRADAGAIIKREAWTFYSLSCLRSYWYSKKKAENLKVPASIFALLTSQHHYSHPHSNTCISVALSHFECNKWARTETTSFGSLCCRFYERTNCISPRHHEPATPHRPHHASPP